MELAERARALTERPLAGRAIRRGFLVLGIPRKDEDGLGAVHEREGHSFDDSGASYDMWRVRRRRDEKGLT